MAKPSQETIITELTLLNLLLYYAINFFTEIPAIDIWPSVYDFLLTLKFPNLSQLEPMENAPAPTEATNALPKGCLPGLHPQRQRFDFDEISIDTLFDSANLANATKYKNFHV